VAVVRPERERHVDLIRAVAIWAVVSGHWLVMAVTEADGAIDGVNALGRLGWTHPFTWLFQVMPLFFFVGGFANATSLAGHRAAGGDAVAWIVRRYRRLVGPAVALLAVVAVAAATAVAAGVDPGQVGTAAWVATVPLWFLAAYLAVIGLAPLTAVAHDRWGLLVPAGGVVAVGLADLARFHLDDPWYAGSSYLVAWLTIHQLGYAWRDGRLAPRPGVGVPLAAAGTVALVGLTTWGPYPVSMVTVPGAEVQNSEPPTLALLALATAQAGVALALRPTGRRLLGSARRWWVVSRVHAVVLTLFLWHMAAAVVAAVVLHGTGIAPLPPVGSAEWWWWRLPWIATAGVVLAALVALFGRFDRAPWDPAPPRPARVRSWAAAPGAAGTLAGILGIAVAGPGAHGPLALPTWALASFATGALLLAVAPRGTETTRQGDHDDDGAGGPLR
jgi:peptidoglycan/LPS O-acetylase OafA/YrhL